MKISMPRLAWVLTLGLAMSLGGAGWPAARSSGTVSQDPGTEVYRVVHQATTGAIDVDPAQRADLQQIASQEAITLAEAIARYGWQETFSDAVARIARDYPGAYASSSMNPDGRVGGRLEFVSEIPPDIAKYLVDLPVRVEAAGGEPLSQADVRRAVETAHFAVRSALPGMQVSSSFDSSEHVVVAEVYGTGADTPSPSTTSAAVEAASRALGKAGVHAQARVRVGPAGGAGSETIRGGAILNFGPGTPLYCTSGWSVRGSGGTTEAPRA